MTVTNRKVAFAMIPATLALMSPALAGHPNNAIERHPTLVGAGAGIATHHALKVAAANAKRHHRHLNFAERHPTMMGIGAGMATHHIIKSHTPR